jgi:hypothetical protein
VKRKKAKYALIGLTNAAKYLKSSIPIVHIERVRFPLRLCVRFPLRHCVKKEPHSTQCRKGTAMSQSEPHFVVFIASLSEKVQ